MTMIINYLLVCACCGDSAHRPATRTSVCWRGLLRLVLKVAPRSARLPSSTILVLSWLAIIELTWLTRLAIIELTRLTILKLTRLPWLTILELPRLTILKLTWLTILKLTWLTILKLAWLIYIFTTAGTLIRSLVICPTLQTLLCALTIRANNAICVIKPCLVP
jgi:hypothetical protein